MSVGVTDSATVNDGRERDVAQAASAAHINRDISIFDVGQTLLRGIWPTKTWWLPRVCEYLSTWEPETCP